MKYSFKLVLLLLSTGLAVNSFGQTGVKTLKAGHEFTISIPDYMSRTAGLNQAASIQFKNAIKDAYGFVIEDTKSELKVADLSFTSVKEYYDYFINNYAKDVDDKKISTTNAFKKGENNYIEVSVSYRNKDEDYTYNDYICIIETPTCFYKVICWSSLEEKDKYKKDFQDIAYSLKD